MQEHVAASMRQVNELSAPGNTPEPVGGPGQDRGPVRQRAGSGRARAVLGRGPDARGAEGDAGRRRRLPAGPDPGLDERRPRPAVEGSHAAAAIEQGAPSVAAAGRRAAGSAAGRASRAGGLTPGRGDTVSGPEYPPPSYSGSAGETSAWVRGAGTPRNCRWAAAAPPTTWPPVRRRVGLRPLPLGDGPSAVRAVAALPPQHHRVVLSC